LIPWQADGREAVEVFDEGLNPFSGASTAIHVTFEEQYRRSFEGDLVVLLCGYFKPACCWKWRARQAHGYVRRGGRAS
jgi:hypothetical protein